MRGRSTDQGRYLYRFLQTCQHFANMALVPPITPPIQRIAQSRYIVGLGKRVLAAWYTTAITRARRRAGAAAFVAAASSILKRRACAQWASQAAASTLEAGQTATALEHGYDRCLRGHLRAWSALTSEKRVLRRGAELLLRGRRAASAAMGFRLWRRRAAEVREAGLRSCRIKVFVDFCSIVGWYTGFGFKGEINPRVRACED